MFKALVKTFMAHPVASYTPPPVEIAPEVWALDRQVSFTGGLRIPARTTIVRVDGEALVVISAPPMFTSEEMEAIDALGVVTWVVVPNVFHYVFAAPFMERYPGARLLLPPGFHRRVDALPDGESLVEATPVRWRDVIAFKTVQPAPELSEVVFLHAPSATLVVTDIAFNMTRFSSSWNTLMWRLFGTRTGFHPARTSHRHLLFDAEITRAFLRDVLTWPFERIVFAHGEVIEANAKARFEAAFARYL